MIIYESFINDLKNVKSKHLLILLFFILIIYFDDETASKILIIIINNCIDIFIKYPFYKLNNYISIKKYTKTLIVLDTFYELINERNKLTSSLTKWKIVYQNKNYWNKDNKHQMEDLLNLKIYVKAIFDCVMSDQLFGMKIAPIIKGNINNCKYAIFENIIERLIKLHKLLGHNFFKTANISTLTIDEFYNLSDDDKIKYIISIQSVTLNILGQTIEIYENFNMINLKIDNLLNPFSINIENDTCTDYDVEDINDFL